MRPVDEAFEAWVERARSTDILSAAQGMGAKLKRVGNHWHGPCPICGGDDRFVVTPANSDPMKRWLCRGARGGDVIHMTQHVLACDFVAAVSHLTGEPPPNGAHHEPDYERARERREERLDDRIKANNDAAQERAAKIETARDLWRAGRDIFGTHGDKYFRQRGIELTEELAMDIRFVPELDYTGFADENAAELTKLGTFPCIIAAMRNAEGLMTAVHRTYLDRKQPRKLVPPGDTERNKAKKVFGKAGGSFIRFGVLGRQVAIGEGTETTLSFRSLGGGDPDCSFVSSYSLGNLAGSCTGSVAHPLFPPSSGKTVPNGEPDMSRPGMVLPESVEEVILIGDGDSDPIRTRALLLTAARRFRKMGKVVSVAMAPEGKDFNNVLIDKMQEGL